MELFYPGSSRKEDAFPVVFHEYNGKELVLFDKVIAKPFKVKHSSEAKPHGLRIEIDSKVIVYSGDTEWTDELIKASEGADVFICECSFYDIKIEGHMDYQTLLENKSRLNCKRLILTHLGEEMLKSAPMLNIEVAEDGKEIIL
jgi:ribonuclease BN (tRNA processing enzyme)